MNKLLISASLGLISLNLNAANRIILSLTSDSFTDVIPIKQLYRDEWQQKPDQDAKRAYSNNQVSLTFRHGHWSFAAGHYIQLAANASEDTLLALWQEAQSRPFDTGRSYQLALELHQLNANFATLGYQLEFNKGYIRPNISFWQATRMRKTQLTGHVSVNDAQKINGFVAFSESYTDNNLLKRPYQNWQQKGKGWSLGFSAQYKWSNLYSLQVDAENLFSSIHFKNTGDSGGEIKTEGRYISELGLANITPLFRGWERNTDKKLRLAYNLVSEFSADRFLLQHRYFAAHHRIYLGWQWQAVQYTAKAWFDPINLMPKVSLKTQVSEWTLGIDKLNPENAKQLNFSVKLLHSWF
ncbi:hypothetical protein [Gayadomonas joobiniege]|uniref:hypothetical protein n=1 Tax=Gayadomonas joobiniege TaxID=1234606 RepID=UPI00037D691E|nr:hypothetical protein [Gayadomonas joobiniege]